MRQKLGQMLQVPISLVIKNGEVDKEAINKLVETYGVGIFTGFPEICKHVFPPQFSCFVI